MIPIVQRELKIIARRKRTFRIRLVITIFAFLWCVALALSGPATRGGSHVFGALTIFAFTACLIQSVRRAASCISDEKSEGTLGLLFLTDLRGLDVILGKLVSVSALSTHALLAFLPVLSMTLVLGGTTFVEVARAALVLATTLLFSMTVGVFVSTISASSKQASIATLALLLASTFVPVAFVNAPLPFQALSWFGLGPLILGISEPGYRMHSDVFWPTLATVNFMSLAAILIASRVVRTVWQDKPLRQTRKRAPFAPRMSRAKMNTLLDRNPAEWLCMRHALGPLGRLVFIIGILAPTIAILGSWLNSGADFLVSFAFSMLALSCLLVIIRVASQASFALAELRTSGALELVLSTPLHPSRLVTGQTMALVRQFTPLLVAQSIALCSLAITQPEIGFASVYWIVVYIFALPSTAATGMWMGLREKSPNAAFTKTLAIVFLLKIPLCCVPQIVFHPLLLLIASAQITGKSLLRLLAKDAPGILMTARPAVPTAPPILLRNP